MFLFTNCKSGNITEQKPCITIVHSLSTKIEGKQKVDFLGINPLIVKNGKPYMMLEKISQNELDSIKCPLSNCLFVPKNTKFMNENFGEKYKDGLVVFDTFNRIITPDNSKTICLIDNKVVKCKKMVRYSRKNKYRLSYLVKGMFNNENELINVIEYKRIK